MAKIVYILDRMTESATQDPRIYLAVERTFLAWVRTGLALMGFGFVVARFGLFLREIQSMSASSVPHSLQASLWFGVALVGLGVGVNVFAAIHHVRMVHQLSAGRGHFDRPSTLGLIVAGILAVVGVAVAIYLIWMHQ
ncbi:MAG: YidH family protein [Acidobacteriaceae bacterium]